MFDVPLLLLLALIVPICLFLSLQNSIALTPAGYRAFRRLDWPKQLSYHGLLKRVVKFLERDGWRLTYTPGTAYDFVAAKNSIEILVLCIPFSIAITTTKILDFNASRVAFGRFRPFIVITSGNVHSGVLDEARRRDIFIVNHRALLYICDESGGSSKIYRSKLDEMAEFPGCRPI